MVYCSPDKGGWLPLLVAIKILRQPTRPMKGSGPVRAEKRSVDVVD